MRPVAEGLCRIAEPHRFATLTLRRRGGCIKSNCLSEIQELQDAHTVLASLDGTDKRLAAADPVGHLLAGSDWPVHGAPSANAARFHAAVIQAPSQALTMLSQGKSTGPRSGCKLDQNNLAESS
jgi:hypothetical protein